MAADNLSSGLLRDEHAELLDVTDRLRNLGLGHHMPLPQLVVCGDQSSGKSSVLESISGVKFPVSDGVCTRFAIQLALRRSLQTTRSVSIEPGKSSSQEQKQRFDEFNKAQEHSDDLLEIVERAKTIMGLGQSGNFSDARLRIEVSGPNQPHLTLVDLPGLIHCPDGSQTDRDVKTVEELVNDYMREDRTIILAVVSASNQAGLQKVLKLAKDNDKDGHRTMGIITKPDTLPSGSEMERKYVRYARNQEVHLGLGWHVVRNASYEECRDQSYDRHCEEHKLFSRNPWRDLPRSALGADELVARLSKCSFELTRAELPNVVQEIQSNIADFRNRLGQLGTARTCERTQRKYLTQVAEAFSQVVADGVDGRYGRADYFTAPERRLRAQYRRLTDAFATCIRRDGRAYDPPPDKYQDYLNIINREILSINRGRELPTDFDPLLVREVFKTQSRKWEELAWRYANEVFVAAKSFVADFLKYTTDAATYGRLMEELIEPAMALKQDMLRNKVTELLTPYTRSYPMSKRPEFEEQLQRIELAYKHSPPTGDANQSAAMCACKKLAEQEKLYYNTALDTFIDNMATLAVENCVLVDLPTMFSPSLVSDMDEQTLARLASESAEMADAREYIKHNLKVFEDALLVCRKCGILTAVLAGGGITAPPAIRSQTEATSVPNHGLDDLADRLSQANLATPEIQLNNTVYAEAKPEAGPGPYVPPSSNDLDDDDAAAAAGRSTRTPSPAHSPNASISSARSVSSMSTPTSSPKQHQRKGRAVAVDGGVEQELYVPKP